MSGAVVLVGASRDFHLGPVEMMKCVGNGGVASVQMVGWNGERNEQNKHQETR